MYTRKSRKRKIGPSITPLLNNLHQGPTNWRPKVALKKKRLRKKLIRR